MNTQENQIFTAINFVEMAFKNQLDRHFVLGLCYTKVAEIINNSKMISDELLIDLKQFREVHYYLRCAGGNGDNSDKMDELKRLTLKILNKPQMEINSNDGDDHHGR